MTEWEKDSESLGQIVLRNLAPYQQQAGLNDRELAKEAGLEQSYIYKVRSGTLKSMGYRQIAKLAAYFGISPEALTVGSSTSEVALPTATVYYGRKFGLTDPRTIAMIEALAMELAGYSRAGSTSIPPPKLARMEMQRLMRAWLRLSNDAHRSLLYIAEELVK